MKSFLHDGYRSIDESSTKASFSSYSDFEQYWRNKCEEFSLKYPKIYTKEDVEGAISYTLDKISSEFKEGDEIIHFDDFGIAIKKCEREFVLLKRNGQIIKSVLIRMS
jgi:hypothetical protein